MGQRCHRNCPQIAPPRAGAHGICPSRSGEPVRTRCGVYLSGVSYFAASFFGTYFFQPSSFRPRSSVSLAVFAQCRYRPVNLGPFLHRRCRGPVCSPGRDGAPSPYGYKEGHCCCFRFLSKPGKSLALNLRPATVPGGFQTATAKRTKPHSRPFFAPPPYSTSAPSIHMPRAPALGFLS